MPRYRGPSMIRSRRIRWRFVVRGLRVRRLRPVAAIGASGQDSRLPRDSAGAAALRPASRGLPAIGDADRGIGGWLVRVNKDETDDSSPWDTYCASDLQAAFDPLSRIYDTIQPYMESESNLDRIEGDDHGNEVSLFSQAIRCACSFSAIAMMRSALPGNTWSYCPNIDGGGRAP